MLLKILRYLIHFFYKDGKIYKVLFGKNKGFKFIYRQDLNTDMILGMHEPNTFEVFDLFVKKGMIVVDIGANIGYFTRYLSECVGSSGQVFSFEPIPSTFERLNESIQMNRLKNVQSIRAAVSNENTQVKMFLSHTHYMASLDSAWAGKKGGEITVDAIRLDDFFKEKGIKPDFIKMDIEGGGVFALEGFRTLIETYEPILFLESHTSEEDRAIGNALKWKPYQVYRVGNSKEVKYFDRDFRDEYGVYGTLIGIPVSKMSTYKDWSPIIFQKKRLGQR